MKRNGLWILIIIILIAIFWYYCDSQRKKFETEKQAAIAEAIDSTRKADESKRTVHEPDVRTKIVYVEKEAEQKAPEKPKKEPDTFTDARDGQQYHYIDVDGTKWMADNLNYETDDSWCYEGNAENCKNWGRLYSWNSAKEACPDGWHLPSDEEWDQLFNFYGGHDVAGKALKEGGSSGFNAQLAGYRDKKGVYGKVDSSAYYWSSTEETEQYASFRGLYKDYSNIGLYTYTKPDGFSVRCVKDAE
ncbi:MAG: FISUMP domain-containing protein [bacterium]|jgi:uncharacterized protein (TIGR02145 family)